MKPSEYLKGSLLIKLNGKNHFKKITMKDVDNRFIDKEELKEKINNKLKNNPYKNDICKTVYSNTLKEVLELIDK